LKSLIACSLLLLPLAAGACRSRDEFLARLTAEAPARVITVSLDRGRRTTTTNRNRRRTRRTSENTETDIRYQYTVGGRTFDATVEKDGDQTSTFKVGMSAKACYNPSNPEESELFPPGHPCGK
jgi:hypothetical protein